MSRIVICGAGVAGSVLANALAARSDVALTVVERSDRGDHLDAGTALNVGPNGMASLGSLSPTLEASLRADSFEWARWQVSLTDGTPLLDFPLSRIAGCSGIRIRWASLYDRLRAPIDPLIRYASTVTSVRYDPEDASGRLSIDIQGPRGVERMDSVDLLVAADGRYSVLREALCGPVPVEHFGIAISRLLVPDSSGGLIDDYAQWFNGPHRLLAYRAPPDHVYIVSTFPLAPGDPITDAMKTADAIDARYLPAGGHLAPACAWLLAAIRDNIDAMHWARMQQATVCFRDPRGRLLVIGDAAHPLVPTLGQGATQAFEDGVVAADAVCAALDEALASSSNWFDVSTMTAVVSERRTARARFAQALSWQASDTLLHGCDPVRDTLRKGEPAYMEQMTRLFGGGPRLPAIPGRCQAPATLAMSRRAVGRIRGCRALVGFDHALSAGLVDIALSAGRIVAITEASDGPMLDTDVDARGRLVVPGTINGHQHSHEHFQKGRLENLPLEIWTHYLRSPRPVPWTPRQVFLRTLIGAIEALRSGCTTLVDDLSLGAALPRDLLAAVHQAYEDVGIRALVGLAMFDKPVDSHFPWVEDECSPVGLEMLRAIPVPDRDAQLRLCEELIQTRHPHRCRVGTVLSASAPQRCTDGFLQSIRALADRHAMPVIIHVQETRLQVVCGELFYGSTMIEHLHRLGFLGPATSLIHAVWLNPREIELLARSGATAQHNPWSNLGIGSGIQPLRELLDAGVNVSLGSDGTASSMSVNMHTVMGSAAGLSKVREADFERWVDAREVFRAATVGGARALGYGDTLGAIEVGCSADLVGYRLDAVALLPLNDPLRQLVYGERGEGVDLIVVDGELAMERGVLMGIDEHSIAEAIAEEHARLAPLFADNERAIEPIRESMARIYRRSLQAPIAADTFPGRVGLPRP